VRGFHKLEQGSGESFRLSTLHFIAALMGRAPPGILTAREGRGVVELFHLLECWSHEGRVIARHDAGAWAACAPPACACDAERSHRPSLSAPVVLRSVAGINCR